MNKTITSLAILKVNWDCRRKDYIENFVPFLINLIDKKNYNIIDAHIICSDFKEEYGLIIPYHPMITIINRARKQGYIKRGNGAFMPTRVKINKQNFSVVSEEQLENINRIISEFIIYSKEIFNNDLKTEDAENIFLTYLKEKDIEILFATQSQTVIPIPDNKNMNTRKFLINSFIKYIYESKPLDFKLIVDITVGHVLASTLLYNGNFTKFQGKLKKNNIYFDTNFIFRLLGLEGKEREDAYIILIEILLKEQVNLFIFQHTYDEILGILNTCLKRMGDGNLNSIKAGSALDYFIQNNYKESDIEIFINKIPDILKKYKIVKTDTPDPDKYRNYQIDEKKLQEFIINIYKGDHPNFDEREKDFTIQKDIKSISSVYILRRGKKPLNIKEANYIFVTTNNNLALANKEFEISEEKDKFYIPVCLTDILLGTLIWLQRPTEVQQINEKKLIAECCAALQPNNELISKLIQQIEKLKNDKKISKDDYFLLKNSRVARNLLGEKTMGDPANFTNQTPEEILEEIKKESNHKYFEEKKEHEKTRMELKKIKGENEEKIKNTSKKAEIVADYSSKIIYIFFAFMAITGVVLSIIPDFVIKHPYIIIFIILSYLLGLIDLILGLNIKDIRNIAKDYVKNNIIKIIKKWES